MTEKHVDDHVTRRRVFLGGVLAGMTGASLLSCDSAAPGGGDPAYRKVRKSGMTIEGLHPGGAPAADVGYTPGISAVGKKIVLVSGQGPADLKVDMETQFRSTFDRIGLILAAAGGSFEDIVMIRGYFIHLARDMPIYRKVRLDYLVKPYPASSLVGVTELAIPGLDIEVEATAVIDR